MELLKDKLFNGISFEIIKEEFPEGYSCPFYKSIIWEMA